MSTSKKELLEQVAECSRQADGLAEKFRRLFRESQEAYSDGDGELAKELSEEGHEAQDECMALNNKVRELRRQAAEFPERPQMALKGIPPDFQNAVFDTLDSLPAAHVSDKVIERISYSGEYKENPVTKITRQANIDFPVMGGKPVIRINKQTREGQWTHISSVKFAVVHEVGHVVYRKFVTDEQKADWGIRFTHPDNNPEEDFANSYAWYYLKRNEMAKEYPTFKTFFEGLNL